jgi:hypothetical protein
MHVTLAPASAPHVIRSGAGGFCLICGDGPNDSVHDSGPILPIPAWRTDRENEIIVNRLAYPRPLRLGAR